MAKEVLEEKSISFLLKAVTHLVKLPKPQMWLDYDSEADVLSQTNVASNTSVGIDCSAPQSGPRRCPPD